ncbi:MAG: hypothetical protein HC850_02370 [Rhodomicrobium sp.]|nr:hypothetical protein [Rhodomicrobium sp.]
MLNFIELQEIFMWPTIPEEAIDYVRGLFRNANLRVCDVIQNNPNERETSFDGVLVDALIPYSAPTILPSGIIVEMDVHNIGGLRRYTRWETADIALLIFVYFGSELEAQKVGFLQSKRLYPSNNDVKDEDPEGFRYGMNAMLWRPKDRPSARIRQTFEFNDDCVYGALKAGDEQVFAIDQFNSEFGEAIYYLFYSPSILPLLIESPHTSRQTIDNIELGCRVASAAEVHEVLGGLDNGRSPTHAALQAGTTNSNWRLETWAADLLLSCRVGRQYNEDSAPLVRSMIERRTGPISAAIAISVHIPR